MYNPDNYYLQESAFILYPYYVTNKVKTYLNLEFLFNTYF